MPGNGNSENSGTCLLERAGGIGVRNWMKKGIFFVLAVFILLAADVRVRAQGQDAQGIVTIKNGVYAEHIQLSGMTEEEAYRAVEDFVSGLRNVEITLAAAGGNQVVVTAGELGLSWANPELVSEAASLGTQGNVIERYKVLKDLEHENMVYPIQVAFDIQAINDFLIQKCAVYDVKAVDAYLVRENGGFRVVEGQVGFRTDVETSIDRINDYLTGSWDYQPCTIELDVAVDEPRGSVEELSVVRDILGTCTTSFKTSNTSRSANVTNGCRLVDGVTLYPGDEFSTYDAVSPFTEKNGYYMAGSYLNGKVVDSLGGGICQVSTTLYNAVLQAELEVTERHNHSMIVNYVDPSADAAIAESSGKDFRFVNNLDYPIYIEGYTENKQITFNIYGVETRDAGYKVRYESEVLEVINPVTDTINVDAAQPIGYIANESSAHIGYKARLWKITLQDGVEVSRTQVNSSTYKMVPRSATVGVATADPHAYEEIMAAIGTGSIDHVKNVIALLTAPSAPAVAAPDPVQ